MERAGTSRPTRDARRRAHTSLGQRAGVENDVVALERARALDRRACVSRCAVRAREPKISRARADGSDRPSRVRRATALEETRVETTRGGHGTTTSTGATTGRATAMRERRGRRDARDGDARRRTDAPRETTTRQVQTTTARKEDVDRDDDVPSLRALRSAHELVVAERDEARGIRERARHCESEARRRLERMKHERDRAREDLKRVLIVVAQVRDGAADVRDLFDFCEASSDAGRDVG